MNLNTYSVYKHILPNNKIYIGITSKGSSRWKNGFGYKRNHLFFKDIVKYGWDNIQHIILYTNLTRDDAYNIEQNLIKTLKSWDYNIGYNIRTDSNYLEKVQLYISNKEDKKDIINLNIISSKRVGRAVYKYDYNKNIINTYNSVADAAKDAGIPVETIRTWCNNKRTPYRYNFFYLYAQDSLEWINYNKKIKKINRYNLSGEYIDSFDSIEEAGRVLNINTKHISSACKNKRNQACGYKWSYYYES